MSSNEPLWWQSGIVYQIYPRSFKDTSGDGIGDLSGIIEKLDYLEWLGITTIWLSPFYPSPMADFGYDIANYTDVDPVFGDLAAFDRLVAEAAAHNIKILIDLVPNHTSDEHPWFLESRSSRANPKRDWYIWRDPQPNGEPPNNWLSNFGGSAWEFDEASGQYYLHLFHVKQPDLNWRNPEVRQAIYDVMRFWLERGVSGFRIDVLHLLIKDDQWRDNPPNPEWQEGDPWYKRQHRVYTEDRPEMQEIIREMRQLTDEYSERVLIGEIYLPYPRLVLYYGEDLKGVHLPFNFQLLLLRDWQASKVRELVDAYEASLPGGAWPNWVLGNHDNPRVASRIGRDQARIAQMLLLTLRGTPTCYYGDELGMQNVVVPPELAHDPEGKGSPGFGRDPERSPMQWDDSPNAGFCPPNVAPWLPLSDDYSEYNVKSEQANPSSMLTFVQKLIQLRQTTEALQLGSYRALDNSTADCFIYLREHKEERYLIILNFSNNEKSLALSQTGKGNIMLSTHLDREGLVNLGNFVLGATEGLIIKL